MEPAMRAEDEAMSTEELLQSQTDLYHHSLAYIKSMALGAAIDLGVPAAIHRGGGAIGLSNLATEIGIHPTKFQPFQRLMRALTVTGVFASEEKDGGGGALYKLTGVSRLLVGVGGRQLSPMVRILVSPVTWATPLSLYEWMADERPTTTLFEVAHSGHTQNGLWEKDDVYGAPFYTAMAADSRVVMEIVLRECRGIFDAVGGSLVDVGGGSGGVVSSAIAKAFPHIKCSVLDLPNVVAAAAPSNVQFIAGDMFEHIPPADVVLLKWILHDWEDQDCVKILRKCKEAIPTRDAGGKVIIIDFVVCTGSASLKETETQVLFDLFIMMENGVERAEHEWSKIFFEAGFSAYKVIPLLGARSVIEVFP